VLLAFDLLCVIDGVMEIKKILFVILFIFVCVKLDIIQYVRVVWSFYIFWSTLRRILEIPIRRMWKRFKEHSCDGLPQEYKEQMNSHKETALFNGLSQMTQNAGESQQMFGTGTEEYFAYIPDGTCGDPVPEFSDELMNNAAMSMF